MLYMQMKVEFLVLPNGKIPTEEFLDSLDQQTVAKIFRYIEILQSDGTLPFPHARKMQNCGGLWELRVLSRAGAVRIFYIYHEKDKVVFVSGFIKKSQKTPDREIDKALGYLKQIGIKL